MNENPTRPFIVVGIDGSDLSAEALHWAVGQARVTDSDIVAVTAYEIPMTIFVVPTYTENDYERDARAVLDLTVERVVAPADGVHVLTDLVRMHPAHALTEAAVGAQLLVVGSHGHGEFPGMHLGSVATFCVHHAPCPVLVFRGAHSGR